MLRRRRSPEAAASDDFAGEVLTYLTPLYATALRLARNPADAEDLVQDTVVKAFRFSAKYQRGTNLKAWLYTILHNTWRNRVRGEARSPVDVDSDLVEEAAQQREGGAPVETPERLLLQGTLDPDLQAALDALPEAFRQAVWLRDVEEFSYGEMAAMLEVPIGTIMSRISRGRRLLYERLTREGMTHERVSPNR